MSQSFGLSSSGVCTKIGKYSLRCFTEIFAPDVELLHFYPFLLISFGWLHDMENRVKSIREKIQTKKRHQNTKNSVSVNLQTEEKELKLVDLSLDGMSLPSKQANFPTCVVGHQTVNDWAESRPAVFRLIGLSREVFLRPTTVHMRSSGLLLDIFEWKYCVSIEWTVLRV